MSRAALLALVLAGLLAVPASAVAAPKYRFMATIHQTYTYTVTDETGTMSGTETAALTASSRFKAYSDLRAPLRGTVTTTATGRSGGVDINCNRSVAPSVVQGELLVSFNDQATHSEVIPTIQTTSSADLPFCSGTAPFGVLDGLHTAQIGKFRLGHKTVRTDGHKFTVTASGGYPGMLSASGVPGASDRYRFTATVTVWRR